MKKLKLLIISVTLLLIPIVSINTVKADMGSPGITTYSARVKNKNGTSVFEYDPYNEKEVLKEIKHLNYDTVIDNIYIEENINGEVYVFSYATNGYVKMADLEVIGNVDLNDFFNHGEGKLYVYREGAYLYKGPSKIYGKVDGNIMLPVGTIIEYKYSDELFAYVTYNGVSGWVYYYQNVLGPYEERSSVASIYSKKIITINEEKLYADPFGKKELNIVVPKDTNLNTEYKYDTNKLEWSFYVTYNGKSGWIIHDVGSVVENASIFNHLVNVNICKERDVDGKICETIDKISANNIIKVKYYIEKGFEMCYFVDFNGKLGWVCNNEDDIISYNLYGNEDNYYILDNDTYLYDDIYGKETKTIVKSGNLKFDYKISDDENDNIEWIHVLDKGWLKVDTSNSEPTEPEESTNPNIPNEPNSAPPTKIIIKDLLVYCIAGACILSLTTIVVIKLVNKKKETNKEETKE